MTKADWLDFFEAINGRSATEEEIAAALAAGEFQDDAPAVETAPTQEAPAQPQPKESEQPPAVVEEVQPEKEGELLPPNDTAPRTARRPRHRNRNRNRSQ